MVETAGTSRFVQRLGEISFHPLDFKSGHPLVPFSDVRMRLRQFVVAGVEEIFQHPEQVEIHKTRLLAEQEGIVREHFLERQQLLLQLREPGGLLEAPLVEAAAAEFALLVPEKGKSEERRVGK